MGNDQNQPLQPQSTNIPPVQPSVPMSAPVAETAPQIPVQTPSAPTTVPSFASTVPPIQPQNIVPPAVSSFPSSDPASQPSSFASAPVAAAPTVPAAVTPAPVNSQQPAVPVQDFKPEAEGQSKLPLIIAGVLLLLALAGGYFLYVLYQTPAVPIDQQIAPVQAAVSPTPEATPTLTEEQQAEEEVKSLQNVSSSDEVTAIEKDVNATDLTTLDVGVSTQ